MILHFIFLCLSRKDEASSITLDHLLCFLHFSVTHLLPKLKLVRAVERIGFCQTFGLKRNRSIGKSVNLKE